MRAKLVDKTSKLSQFEIEMREGVNENGNEENRCNVAVQECVG